MPTGLITSLFLKLTVDYWYFTLIALLIKLALLRFTVTNTMLKSLLLWLVGTVIFYFIACFIGIVFSSAGLYYIPLIMFFFAIFAEIYLSSMLFRIEPRKLTLAMISGNALLFILLFIQMV
jgi:hypothetical protein